MITIKLSDVVFWVILLALIGYAGKSYVQSKNKPVQETVCFSRSDMRVLHKDLCVRASRNYQKDSLIFEAILWKVYGTGNNN